MEVALERGGTAEVSIDGEARQVRIDAGEPAALEAERELRLDLPGIGVVHVRGGRRDLLREAAAAEERWNGAARPVLARAGCTTLRALEALRARADALLETVSGLERQAEQERARAEGLDELERRAVVAKADVEQRRAALASCSTMASPWKSMSAVVTNSPAMRRPSSRASPGSRPMSENARSSASSWSAR